MGRDDNYIVRHRSIPSQGESNTDRSVMNKFGSQIATDMLMQWWLSGYTFHMQTGTEDAPITTNGPLDDEDGLMVADNNSGFMVPLRYHVDVKFVDTAVTTMAMLEVDMDKKRYTSGGTVFVPEQLNGAATSAAAANGTFFTIEGSDLVIAAKTAVPASVEFARQILNDDVITDPTNGQLGGLIDIYNIRRDGPVGMITPGALVCHFGALTADPTGYGTLDFAQFDSNLAW